MYQADTKSTHPARKIASQRLQILSMRWRRAGMLHNDMIAHMQSSPSYGSESYVAPRERMQRDAQQPRETQQPRNRVFYFISLQLYRGCQ